MGRIQRGSTRAEEGLRVFREGGGEGRGRLARLLAAGPRWRDPIGGGCAVGEPGPGLAPSFRCSTFPEVPGAYEAVF